MLMRPDDGGIDHDVLEIWIVCQSLEKTLPNPFVRPAIKPHEHAIPLPECQRQIMPRRARAQNPGYGRPDATHPLCWLRSSSGRLLRQIRAQDMTL
jgi:hypothetical protein